MRKAVSLLSTCLFVAALSSAPAFAQSPGGDGPEPPPEPASSPAPVAASPAPAGNPGAMHVATDGAGAKARGLYFEVGLGGQMTLYGGYGVPAQQLGGSFLIGYKLNRLIFGLGLEYSHMAEYENAAGDKEHFVLNAMLFQPTIQFHIVESNPLALFLTTGIHLGFAIFDETGTSIDDDTTITLLGFHLGVGIRYFLHPRFAIGIEGGFRGLWVLSKYDPPGGEYKTTNAVGGLYGRIGFAAVW